ncbi:hypothetical protein DRW41_13165 [Neobacillus piezotolerans]|uniref:Uncharacterized protein n=1 Tax=Neobacillus piezotolerans TaxID=2259171 RepID=A0A3D8GPR8_9BACI|nr:hypothetical protein DRW41_13165 [Neobacillus piezotolerans]
MPDTESREGWEPVQGGWLNGLARGCLNDSRAARVSAVKRIGYRIMFPYPKEGVDYSIPIEVAPRSQNRPLYTLFLCV